VRRPERTVPRRKPTIVTLGTGAIDGFNADNRPEGTATDVQALAERLYER
jgi:hypothetical protein